MEFEKRLKDNKSNNCYIFCGYDEQLIKENIKLLIDISLNKELYELNFAQFDGANIDCDSLINACETLPFMSEKRIVIVYRADFLKETEDKSRKKTYEIISNYIDNVPPSCILVLYYVFENKREKPSKSIIKLDKKTCVVKTDRLKGQNLTKRVKELFDIKGKEIGMVELNLFCGNLDGDMGVIENEVDKLYWFTYGREIKKEDIKLFYSNSSDDDIFDVVDFLSQRKVNKALELINELIVKGEKSTYILRMVERQFKLLLLLKIGIEASKSKNSLTSELKLNPYICEKMMLQSKKFTLTQIEKSIELCLETEKRIKSSSCDDKTEMELLIINTMAV